MPVDLMHNPRGLYEASLDRLAEARKALNGGDYALCMYLSGLAVECILQAIVFLDRPSHDARHDLTKWLRQARASLQDAIKAQDTRAEWDRLLVTWRNGLRYLSQSGLLGFLRKLDLDRGISGTSDDIMRINATRLVSASERVHRKGVAAWQTYTTR